MYAAMDRSWRPSGSAPSFVPGSAPGCHVCDGSSSWIISRRRFSRRDYGLRKGDAVPDLSLDPQSKVLALINTANLSRAYFVSVVTHECRGRRGKPLFAGVARDAAGKEANVTTLIVTVAPRTVVEACTVQVRRAREAQLHSDIVELKVSPRELGALGAPPPLVVGFPLVCSGCGGGSGGGGGGGGPFLCSQGVDGGLTHFAHAGTRHAIDLDAPVGTEVCAVGDGVVASVQQDVTESGVHVALFFRYNALVLQLDAGGASVEYVHIRAGSARVAPGQRVARGQVLCESGDAGFCPVPHLHIEAHISRDHDAPSIPLAFECAHTATPAHSGCDNARAATNLCDEGSFFVPIAGCWYDERGEVEAPPGWCAQLPAAGAQACGGDDAGDEEACEEVEEGSSSGWETVDEDSAGDG